MPPSSSDGSVYQRWLETRTSQAAPLHGCDEEARQNQAPQRPATAVDLDLAMKMGHLSLGSNQQQVTKAPAAAARKQPVTSTVDVDAEAANHVDRIYEELGLTHRVIANLSMRERGKMLRRLHGNPFMASPICRPSSAAASSGSRAGVATPGALTYGEIPASEALRIVGKAVGARQGGGREVFCDLGSGRGQVVLAVYRRWTDHFAECRGIEALSGLVELSSRASAAMVAEVRDLARESHSCKMTFSVADFLSSGQQWLDADVVYIVGTCFPTEWFESNGALCALLLRLKVGARVCVVTQSLRGVKGFRVIASVRDLKATWGDCIARVYERWDDSDGSDEDE